MDWSHITIVTAVVLMAVLLAEAANGWTDAPCGTSSAVASGNLSSRTALWLTAISNLVGLLLAYYVGAKVAKTIGTGIVKPEVITVAAVGVAMVTSVLWSLVAAKTGLAVSKSHTLIASLIGVGYGVGGTAALFPPAAPGETAGWLLILQGVFYAIAICFFASLLVSKAIKLVRLDERLPESFWRWAQRFTVAFVGTGHGFGDGLKYVGVFTLVLYKSGIITEFHVYPEVIILCAVVLGSSTLMAGWRIHQRLDQMVNGIPVVLRVREHPVAEQVHKKSFRPYMGVASELVSSFAIWQSGFLGIPMSTNHAVVSAMAGARSSAGKVHTVTTAKIIGGWVLTYGFCIVAAVALTRILL